MKTGKRRFYLFQMLSISVLFLLLLTYWIFENSIENIILLKILEYSIFFVFGTTTVLLNLRYLTK